MDYTQGRYTDTEIVNLITSEIQASLTDEYSGVSEQRSLAHKYYNGELPNAPDSNTSTHVARTVFDSVESMKNKLLRVFTANRKVVRFEPTSEDDVLGAQLRTDYVHAILNDNGLYKLLNDVFHDGLLTKLACVKRTWEERSVPVVEDFMAQPLEVLEQAMQMDEGIDDIVLDRIYDIQQMVPTDLGPVTRMVRVADGEVHRKEDRSRVDLEVIPPEDVFFSSNCVDPAKADFVAVRYRKPKYELIEMGFDPEQVERISGSESLHNEIDKYSRHSYDGTYDREKGHGKNEREEVTVYEAYMTVDLETPKGQPPQKAMRWQFFIAGKELLGAERVDEVPLRFWTPIMVSHKAIGLSEADVTMDLQKADSNIVRGMIDHIYRTNTGLRRVDMTLVRNPRDLLSNPIGGIIDAPDNMRFDVLPQAPLSAATGQVLEILANEREARTGDTRLGRGLQAQDVVTHQNSKDMIDTLMNAGNERVLQMARGFAEILWKPLMLDIYRLGYDNGQVVNLNIKGQYQPFNPQMIPYGEEMTVDVALTPEYGQAQAQQLFSIHNVVREDPELSMLYGPKERFALMSEVFDLLGQPNWLADPDDPEVQQRMEQRQQKQAQDEAFQRSLIMRKANLDEMKVKGDQALKKEKLDLDAEMGADKQDLDEREFEWQKQVDVAEVALESQQERPVGLN